MNSSFDDTDKRYDSQNIDFKSPGLRFILYKKLHAVKESRNEENEEDEEICTNANDNIKCL